MKPATLELARFNMVEQQIRPWEVTHERVLAVMQEVPRERFVPNDYLELAFADTEIPLGHGQSMLAPRLQAHLLQALDVQPAEHVLEIGTGSGFLSACLAKLGNSVTSYEILPEILDSARERLTRQGVNNVSLHLGNGLEAGALDARFDAIAVTGSLPCPDERLEALLAPGGRMFVVEGTVPIMTAWLVRKDQADAVSRKPLFETCVPQLKQARQMTGFKF